MWALRRASLPVGSGALVLDVGSGHTPYPRADVLLDRPGGDVHRMGQILVVDRPMVFGDAMKMPFKDKAFDFVIASHILEHMKDPAHFLKELSRVAKAGYIETPNAIGEELVPLSIHCLEVMKLDDKLVIRKKSSPSDISFLGDLKIHERNELWQKLFHQRPELFNTRYFWKDKIEFEITNPEVSCDWIDNFHPKSGAQVAEHYAYKGWRMVGVHVLSAYYRLRRRTRKINLENLLACPKCKGDLEKNNSELKCKACGNSYANIGHPDFCNYGNNNY